MSEDRSNIIGDPGLPTLPVQASDPIQLRLQAALSADIPTLYANSFAIVIGTADSTIVLEQNGKPVAVLNLSFTSSKTLAAKLGGVIAHLEENSGRPIMTTDDIEGMFSAERRS